MKRIYPVCIVALLFLAGAVPASAERLSVKVGVANVRAEPDTNAAVIWQVERYHPVNILHKQGSWYQFEDFEGDRGWIHNSLLANVEAVVVKKDNVNVRSGPGTGNAVRFTVDKGVPFKVIEKKGKWIRVKHSDGDEGWIHGSLIW